MIFCIFIFFNLITASYFHISTKTSNDLDHVIKSQWDPTKSAAVNMANMGLQASPNTTILPKSSLDQIIHSITPQASTSTSTSTKNSKAIELFDIPDSDIIPKQTKAMRMFPVSVSDQKYLVRLMEKYGDNYKQMSRDIKLNDMQHTEGKLRKMCARFYLLTPEQRRVDIPEKVKHLMC